MCEVAGVLYSIMDGLDGVAAAAAERAERETSAPAGDTAPCRSSSLYCV